MQEQRNPGQDYAAWSEVNINGAWTQAAEASVARTSLSALNPADIQSFCPAYAQLDADSRVKFWVGLLSAIAKFESNFKPETEFIEKLIDREGNRVVSRGLLQLSIESANQDRYACNITAQKDLHDPEINLSCGARILATWVEADDLVASTVAENIGGGRYWAVLRPASGRLEQISALTRQFPFCGV